jgi:5'-deoxynucleotidase YfbR-like HD superfamily hydrolase
MTDPWIQTYTLRAFDLLAPTPEMVCAEDIAHALSRLNRFSGHTHGEPYSVAHHSMLVADLLASWGAPPAIVREGLLHDAGEAYYGDITSPVKRALNERSKADERVVLDWFGRVSRDVDRVVRSALMLPEHESAIVKRADLVALAIERRDLFGAKAEPRDWALPEYAPTSAPCGRCHDHDRARALAFSDTVLRTDHLCSWDSAKRRFLALLAELDAQIARAA